MFESFSKTPKRRNQADYYEVVKNPIDLSRIQQKVRMQEYDDLEQLSADIELLVSNAKAYYKEDTSEHQDAVELLKVFNELKITFDQDEEMSITSSEVESTDLFEEIFTSVMEAETEDGRLLSKMFELLPSKRSFPSYYDVISDPIDLKIIGTKIQEGKYGSLNDLEKDFTLLIENAKTFNQTHSQIWRDANSLKKIFSNKKYDIENRKHHSHGGSHKSERLRAKKPTPQKWSALVASLKYEDDEELISNEDDEDEDEGTIDETTANYSDGEDTESTTNPYWLLYDTVKDSSISEPFKKLPSKRLYPDYYVDIANPISLEQVSQKIKRNEYENVSKLMQDLCLIFDNAMQFNIDESKIFKDAKKLKSILQMKFNDISNLFDEDNEEAGEGKQQIVAFELGKPSAPRNSRKSSKSMANAMNQELKNLRKSQSDSQLKKRLKILYKTLMDYNEHGDYLIDPFKDKPSKKMYPDYYDVIRNPIDMKTIDNNIKNDSVSLRFSSRSFSNLSLFSTTMNRNWSTTFGSCSTTAVFIMKITQIFTNHHRFLKKCWIVS